MSRRCTCTGDPSTYCPVCHPYAVRAGLVPTPPPVPSTEGVRANRGVRAIGRSGHSTIMLLFAPQSPQDATEEKNRVVDHATPERFLEPVRGIPGQVTLILAPLRTYSPLNSMAARHTRMRRSKRERKAAYDWLTHWLPTLPAVWWGCDVFLTRIAPRFMDDDNLQGSLKHVRDGVADWWDSNYLHGDDAQPALVWYYRQCRKPGEYAVEIRLIEHKEP